MEERFDILAVLGVEADADAAGDMDVLILYGIGLITDVEQAARHFAGGGGLVEAGQQNAELIAVPARDRVMGARGEAQARGDFHQQRIADRVAVTAVDVFEAIEIEKQHR